MTPIKSLLLFLTCSGFLDYVSSGELVSEVIQAFWNYPDTVASTVAYHFEETNHNRKLVLKPVNIETNLASYTRWCELKGSAEPDEAGRWYPVLLMRKVKQSSEESYIQLQIKNADGAVIPLVTYQTFKHYRGKRGNDAFMCDLQVYLQKDALINSENGKLDVIIKAVFSFDKIIPRFVTYVKQSIRVEQGSFRSKAKISLSKPIDAGTQLPADYTRLEEVCVNRHITLLGR